MAFSSVDAASRLCAAARALALLIFDCRTSLFDGCWPFAVNGTKQITKKPKQMAGVAADRLDLRIKKSPSLFQF
jgi:hypothetical protein